MTKPSMVRAQFLSEREALHKRVLDRVQWSERLEVDNNTRYPKDIGRPIHAIITKIPGTPQVSFAYFTDQVPILVREGRMDAITVLIKTLLFRAEKQCGLSDADLALLTS